jgi:hypothetical protein
MKDTDQDNARLTELAGNAEMADGLFRAHRQPFTV